MSDTALIAPMADDPTEGSLDMICGKCKREWRQVFPLPMEARVFVRALGAVRCPTCGSTERFHSIRTGEAR